MIKRYEEGWWDGDSTGMVNHPDGGYVKYEDYKKQFDQDTRTITRLNKLIHLMDERGVK